MKNKNYVQFFVYNSRIIFCSWNYPYLSPFLCFEVRTLIFFLCLYIVACATDIFFHYWLPTHSVHVRPDLHTDSVRLDVHL